MPAPGVEEGHRQPLRRSAEREHGVANQGARARAQPCGANGGPGSGAVTVNELGPGLNRVGAEISDGPNATADVVAALDHDDLEPFPRKLARGGQSRHPGADDEDIGAVGSTPMVRRVAGLPCHRGSVTEVSRLNLGKGMNFNLNCVRIHETQGES